MAAADFSRVKFVTTLDNAFYFQVGTETDTDVLSDSFSLSSQQSDECFWVRSKENKTLLLIHGDEMDLQAQNLNKAELTQNNCKFKIQTYNTEGKRGGVPAMLYVNKDNENIVVCCGQDHKIYPQPMVLPNRITDTKHGAIFYKTKLEASNAYQFESSLHEGEFLGFQPADDPSLNTLSLHPKNQTHVVEASVINLLSAQR